MRYVTLVLIVLSIVYPVFSWWKKQRAEKTGRIATATVVDLQGTGVYEAHQPVMRITVDVDQPDGTVSRRTVSSTITPGTSMAPGSRIMVVEDPRNPKNAYFPEGAAVQRAIAGLSAPAKAMLDVPPQFPGAINVCDVVAINPQDDGTVSVQLDLINIGEPKQTIFARQRFPAEPHFTPGDRVFVKLDATVPPQSVYILPPEFANIREIPRTGNRVDSVVLADQLLFKGARAKGNVLSTVQQQLPDAYTRAGASKWLLQMAITPDDGTAAYEGSMTVAVTTPEKAATITRLGATLPLRYDSSDPATFTLDSIALGWGDPKLAQEQAARISAQMRAKNQG